ncbi:microtubule-associated proteins 1A/1B light chain 3C-like [Hemiscyllium ocellatum]|uniref:microtubule-associated proteins 1A/1B light chain 3C-like n=1 Tax=Hemiscyllium ocellatum TaxID=170820 RepID=UPI002966734C|nr:microtubule-associated proteins 1A/1B light chain 3C-like [Hemiscyllium ocellatum]
MAPSDRTLDGRPFKERRSLAMRRNEVLNIRNKYPNKLPVIVERYPKERSLPHLDKSKYLVPLELSLCQFMMIIRSRMSVSSSQAFYLMVNDRSLASMSLTMAEIYAEYREEDGFLYMTYASQEMFGCSL